MRISLSNASVLPGENPRSAGFQSAVSRISNPLALENSCGSERAGGWPNGIRRYSRLEICATAGHARGITSLKLFHAAGVFPLRMMGS
jgi:hypothetical protein